MVSFNESYIAGFDAKVYDIDVNAAFAKAQKLMEESLQYDCAGECKIDEYRNLKVKTNYSNQTYKHILLPVWLGTYTYGSKQYQFRINGQTGQINGIKALPEFKSTALRNSLIITAILVILYLIGRLAPTH